VLISNCRGGKDSRGKQIENKVWVLVGEDGVREEGVGVDEKKGPMSLIQVSEGECRRKQKGKFR